MFKKKSQEWFAISLSRTINADWSEQNYFCTIVKSVSHKWTYYHFFYTLLNFTQLVFTYLPSNLQLLIDLINKSQNAPVPYPTMLHSEQRCAHFCSEWSIVGYGTGAFWDLWNWFIQLAQTVHSVTLTHHISAIVENFTSNGYNRHDYQGPFLLTWIIFNPSMDK